MGACRELPAEYYAPKPQTLAEIILDEVMGLLVSKGAQPEVALVMAQACVNRCLVRAGGGQFYLPKSFDYLKAAKDERNRLVIRLAHSGTPIPAIGRTVGLKKTRVYEILAKKR